MNRNDRESIEKMVASFPDRLIKGWEKNHPEIGGTLETLRADCLKAERELDKVETWGFFGFFGAIFGSIIVAALAGVTVKNKFALPITWVIAAIAVTVTVGCIVGFKILSLRDATKAAFRDVIFKYEVALKMFEQSAERLDLKIGEVAAMSDLTPDGIILNCDRMAMVVLGISRHSRQVRLDTEAYDEAAVVAAGLESIDIKAKFKNVLEAFGEFGVILDEDAHFKAAKSLMATGK